MLWSLFSAISPIYGEKIGVLKTYFMINFLQKLARCIAVFQIIGSGIESIPPNFSAKVL
jgi:hypothetical protein